MNQARRSLLTHTRKFDPLGFPKSYFKSASKQLSQFILNSFQRVSSLFKTPFSYIKPTYKEPNNELKGEAQAKEGSKESYNGLRLCFSKKSYQNQLLEDKQIDSNQTKARIYNDSSPQLINNLNHQLSDQIEEKNRIQNYIQSKQVKVIQENAKGGQENQLQVYKKGAKKVKRQEEIKITKQEAREVQILINQTPEAIKHFTSINNQVIQDIVDNQPKQSQKKKILLQMRQQALNNYEKMMREPKKAAVNEFKEARKLMRELVSKQADIEKRFQLRLLQQRRRAKERMRIYSVNQLKLDMILPNYQKIVSSLRQEKLRKKSTLQLNNMFEETKQGSNVDSYQMQKTPIQRGFMQEEQSEKPTNIAQIEQNFPNKPENSEFITSHQQTQNKSQVSKLIIKQKQENQSQSQRKQEIIKDSQQSNPIYQGSLAIFRKQNLKFQISASLKKLPDFIKKEQNETVQCNEIRNRIELNPVSNQTAQVLQTSNKSTTQVLQTSNKPTNPFANAKNVINKEPAQKQPQNTQPQAQQSTSIKKFNPFLTSAPLKKISFDDLIVKNPQFTIINTKSPSPLPNPSLAAEVFRTDHSSPGNLFKNVCQQNYQQLQGSVQQHSNSFNFQHQQQQQLPNNSLIGNRSFFMAAPNQSSVSYINSINPNQGQLGYQSGISADTQRVLSMFQSSQTVQGGLFSESSSKSSTNRNYSKGHQGSSRHKKNKDIRIA